MYFEKLFSSCTFNARAFFSWVWIRIRIFSDPDSGKSRIRTKGPGYETLVLFGEKLYLRQCPLVERKKIQRQLGPGRIFDNIQPVVPHFSAVEDDVAPEASQKVFYLIPARGLQICKDFFL